MDHPARRALLGARLDDLQADAFLVTRPANVRFLTGFTGSNGHLLLSRTDAAFLTDGRYVEQAGHECPDLPTTVYTGDFRGVVADACSRLGARRVAFEGAGITYRTFDALRSTGLDLVPTSDEVERLRWAKSPEEIRAIEAAQAIADDAFDAITGKLAEGMTERDVALELDVTMRRAGAEAIAFDTIVAFGENAAEPHHSPTRRPLQRGDVVKLDFGCVVDGYHSDMTRTLAFGTPDPRIVEIHGIVLAAHLAGLEAVRPGAVGGDVDRVARDVIAEAGYGDRYGHSLGHGVGLEIHEGPTLRAGGTDVLPEAAVVTVEPGIYVGGLGGVRIEDMVVVTGEGCRPLPRTRKELVVL